MTWTTSYYHYDALGTTRELTDGAQAVSDRYVHDAYGNQRQAEGSTTNPFRYVGQLGYYYDSDAGTMNVRQRVYAPKIIRWLSSDPLGSADDANRYRYVRSAPLQNVDPLGLASFFTDLVAKSYINGIPIVGSIVPDRMGAAVEWVIGLPSFFQSVTGTATERLAKYARWARGLGPFNELPVAPAKDGKYRLYTRIRIEYECCGDSISLNSWSSDMDGGFEGYALGIPFWGTIALDGGSRGSTPLVRKQGDMILVVWRGWGHPNAITAEPTFQWVGTRIARNIWHHSEVWLSCSESKAHHEVKYFEGSQFPTHRLWINGNAQSERTQKALSNLWYSSWWYDATFVR